MTLVHTMIWRSWEFDFAKNGRLKKLQQHPV